MRKKAELNREELESQMAAFLAKGGEIKQVERGVSSQVFEVIYDTKYGNYRYKNQDVAKRAQKTRSANSDPFRGKANV